jgi:putative flippase GtrA
VIKKFLNHDIMRFLMGGVFMKSLSFLFNYVFAGVFKFDTSTVYGLVLVFDLLLGYFVNRHFVFNQTQTKRGKTAMVQFLLAGIGFRLMDWGIYLGLLEYFKIHLLLAQSLSTGFILSLKFIIYRVIFN